MYLLVIEDEWQTREGLKRIVPWGELGITEVAYSTDGEAALKDIRQRGPDIILSDVRMPHMSGVELLKVLRESDDYTPFIFLSGFTDKEYLLSAIRYHATDYIEKPVHIPQLIAVFRQVIDQMQCNTSTPSKKQITTRLPQKHGKPLDVAHMLASKHSRYSPAVSKVLEILESRYTERLTTETLAREAFVSVSHLNYLFSKEVGQSINQYLINLRIKKAKELLCDPNVKLYEVCRRVGIDDAAYFSKLFRKQTHMTPSQYRESMYAKE